ncbi:MAG: IS256 family transposase [Deltaproteobacteria bacterium]|nr:IS256 family transposase [Deltaproteobacteria bacterium]
MWLDCIYVSTKVEDEGYVKQALYVVVGLDDEGKKDILGLWLLRSETSREWVKILNDLKARGVRKVNIIITDNLAGIKEAVSSVFPSADHQLCVAHKVRESMKKVSAKDRFQVVKDLKVIYKATTVSEAEEGLKEFKAKWNGKYPDVVKMWEKDFQGITSFFKYPFELRRLITTTNVIESVNSKLRKVLYAKRSMPSERALLKVCYGVYLDLYKRWSRHSIPNWYIINKQLEILFDKHE